MKPESDRMICLLFTNKETINILQRKRSENVYKGYLYTYIENDCFQIKDNLKTELLGMQY